MASLYVLVPPSPVYGWTGLPQALFCWKATHLSQTCPCLTQICIFTNSYCLCIFLRTPNRRVTNRQSRWRLNFVLSSHIDPIGEQNNVQYMSIFVNMWFIFGISGNVPTYGTGHNIHINNNHNMNINNIDNSGWDRSLITVATCV